MSNSGRWQKYKYTAAALIAVVVFYGFISGVYFFESHNQPANQAQFRKEFGDVTVSVFAQNISEPPVPMYTALVTALDSGGWNKTSLENMTVNVSFNILQFCNDSKTTPELSGRCVPVPQVPRPSNYTAATFSNATYSIATWYVWCVTVTQTGGIPGSPVPTYWVDATTDKIIPPTAVDYCPG